MLIHTNNWIVALANVDNRWVVIWASLNSGSAFERSHAFVA